jgi:hypothetical protein
VDEATWLACDDPEPMLTVLRDARGRAGQPPAESSADLVTSVYRRMGGGALSERKARLFAAACCRGDWASIGPPAFRDLVETAERFADGRADLGALREAKRRAKADPAWGGALGPLWAAYLTAGEPVNFITLDYDHGPEYAHRHVGVARCVRADLLRCIFGNPFHPVGADPAWLAWNGGTVGRLAEAAYEERALPSGHLDAARLGVLADALEEAVCADNELLGHLRAQGPHVRGCFAVDLLLGRP